MKKETAPSWIDNPLVAAARWPTTKLTEIQYDMNNFSLIVLFPNADFKILTSYWLVIALDQHYDVIDWSDYQREKSITISKHDFLRQ